MVRRFIHDGEAKRESGCTIFITKATKSTVSETLEQLKIE